MSRSLLVSGLAALVCVILVGVAWSFDHKDREPAFYASTPICFKYFGKEFFPDTSPERYYCEQEKDERGGILFIGDSHASMLYHGFLSMGVTNAIHIGKGSCAPIWKLNPSDAWLKCQPDTDKFMELATIIDTPLVIMTGVFERYFDGKYQVTASHQEVDHDIDGMFDLLGRIKSPVLLVLDNPSLPFSIDHCRRTDCTFDRADHDHKAASYKALFRQKASRAANVRVLDASTFFCDDKVCRGKNDEGVLYRDDNHLGPLGAKMVDRAIIKMFPKIVSAAR